MADSSIRPKSKFVLRYIWGTTVGWMLALLALFPPIGIWLLISAATRQYFPDTLWYEIWDNWLARDSGRLLTIVAFLLMGASIGFAQWHIALKEKVSRRVWIRSCTFTVVAGVFGLFAASYIPPPLFTVHSGNYSGFDTSYSLNTTWLITVLILGGMTGFAIGLPQWLVLRRQFYNANVWLIIPAVAGIALFAAYAAIIAVVKNNLMSWACACLASPIVFAGVTGTALYNLLKRPKTPLP